MSLWNERFALATGRAQRCAIFLLLAVAEATLLSGCVLGPTFKPPAAPQTTTYSRTPLTELGQGAGMRLESTLPVPAQWWTLLEAPRLDQTIQAALTGNLDLAAVEARLQREQEMVRVSEAALYPDVDLSASVGRVKYGPAFLGPTDKLPPFTFYSVGPAVSYAFDYLGGTQRGVEQQRALAEAQQQQMQAAALVLSGNVATQALTLASSRAQLSALEAVLENDRRNLQLVQTAFDAGGATRVDILNAQSQLNNDATLLPPLRRQVALANDALALLVGQAPGDFRTPDFALDEFHLPTVLPLTLPSELAHRRPDIQAAEARLHAATAAVGVATANLYPQISLSANASFQSNVLRQLFNASGIGSGVTGSLMAPLFDHGALRAKQRAAVDELHAALAEYQQTVLRAFGQVADALQGLDHDQELLLSEEAAVQTTSQNLQLTRESYSAGNSGVLQVLDAQRQDEQAQVGIVRVQAQRFQDTVQLLLALGGPIPPAAFSAQAATQPVAAR